MTALTLSSSRSHRIAAPHDLSGKHSTNAMTRVYSLVDRRKATVLVIGSREATTS